MSDSRPEGALERCSPAAFESRYRADPDPWNFATSVYERGRYSTLLDSLTRDRYGTAFEPGCSVGELTAHLSARCERVIATDIAPSAVAQASRRCARSANVEVHCAGLDAGIPDGRLDLIVFSEIGYYFQARVLRRIIEMLAQALQPGGEFVAVHWLGDSRDHVLHGDAVHELLMASLPFRWLKGARHSGFRIDTWLAE